MPANSAANFPKKRFSIRFTRDAAKASQLWNAYIAEILRFSWCASAMARARAFRHGRQAASETLHGTRMAASGLAAQKS
jgi:hypothetical protein